MDRYTKVVLTLIAIALWANLAVGFVRPGASVISEARAQNMVQPMGYNGSLGYPVYITGYVAAAGANPTFGPPPVTVAQGSVLPVNLVGVSGHSLQDPSVTLPVTVADVTGVGGASVRGTGAIPVNPGSRVMPVSVSSPVSVSGDVSVIVKKMPPPQAQAPASQSTTTPTSPPSSGAPGT